MDNFFTDVGALFHYDGIGVLSEVEKANMAKISGVIAGGKLPPGWTRREAGGYDGVWDNISKCMRVIYSLSRYQNDNFRLWVHLSISHRVRIPHYDDLVYLKRNWIGDEVNAIMVLPKKSEHVNIHPRCLHLFHCVSGDGLPDFTIGTRSL
jgi:hypothetical protein